MSQPVKPIFTTVTEGGQKIVVEAPDIILPSTAHIPSNVEVQHALSSTKEVLHEGLEKGQLDDQGKVLEKDLEGIIDSASKLLQEKNKDEKLQSIIRESQEGTTINLGKTEELGMFAKQKMEPSGPEAQKLQEDVRELYGYLRNLSYNFVRSADFRRLLADWVQFLQSMSTEKISELALKYQGETKIGEAVSEGLTQPPKPASQEELQRRTEDRLREILIQIRSRPEYQSAFRDFFKLLDTLKHNYESMKQQATGLETQHFQKALDDAREFISEFSGKLDTERFRIMLWDSYNSIVQDSELSLWLTEFRIFVENSVYQPELLTEQETKLRAEELLKRGRLVLQKEKWRKISDDLSNQFFVLLTNIRTDSTTLNFTSRLEKFGRDMLFNQEGLPDVFVLEDSISQMRNLIVPLVKKQLENMPIKRIDIVNDTYDVRIEDIIFDATSFMPEHLDFRVFNASHLDFKDSRKDVTRHQLLLQVDKIKPEFKQLKFYYRRKSFPKIEDYGVADVAFKGDGAFIRIVWTIETVGNALPISHLTQVKCEIDKINIHIVGEATKHDILDTLMAPLLSSMFKSKISSTIEEYLTSKLQDVNIQINEWLASRPTQQLKMKADKALKESYLKQQQISQTSATVQAK